MLVDPDAVDPAEDDDSSEDERSRDGFGWLLRQGGGEGGGTGVAGFVESD